MSDDLKKMLIAMAVKSKESKPKNDMNILIAASVNIHDNGLPVIAAPNPAAQFIFGGDFIQKQLDLLGPVLDQVAKNFEKEIMSKEWEKF